MSKDVLIGIDAGTSVIKSVAFDLAGSQIAIASVPNKYETSSDGAATQSLNQTWQDCAQTLRDLADLVPGLSSRTLAVAVTGQGDGTWLVGKGDRPVGDGWLWLDARAAPTVHKLRDRDADQKRFEATGTGLNSCQQGTQLAHMQAVLPELLEGAEAALHCKDWLFLKLTGMRATDPSEACFTFGDFRTRTYDQSVIEALGVSELRHLLPEIIDGSQNTIPLSQTAADETGLLAGTPISLGYVDVVCTAMGAGAYAKGLSAGCTILGTTGMHLRSVSDQDVYLNEDRTGYVMTLPVAGQVAQIQSNMAATLNIDWMLNIVEDLASQLGNPVARSQLLSHVDRWINAGKAGSLLYHPYISEAGERGPFVNNAARASFVGLNSSHQFADLFRAVAEGLALAGTDCYNAMGGVPGEVRLTGGAAKSAALRGVMAAAMNTQVRVSSRGEAGAAGAAMMAAVATGVYGTMDACVDEWVTPLIGEPEAPAPELLETYADILKEFVATRKALEPIWQGMATLQEKI
ncbi:MAG: FGGY-family carbohydrate kinase [Hyphomicrobiales bacterium]